MIQNYNEIHARVNSFNSLFAADSRNIASQVQKIYSTHQFICLQIRFPGKTRYLYLGRGGGFEGLWCEESRPPAKLRIRDKFVEYLRKHLSGHYIRKILLDPNDRIISLQFGDFAKSSYLFLFYCGRDLYFAHLNSHAGTGYQLFLSWKKIDKPILDTESSAEAIGIIQEEFNSIGRLNTPKDVTAQCIEDDCIKYYFDSLKGTQVNKISPRKKKFLNRKLKKIQIDLNRISSWQKVRDEIENPSFSFGDKHELVIQGVKFKFHGELSHFKKMNIVYNKIKSLRAGEEILKKRLAECESEIIQSEQVKTNFEYLVPDKLCQPVWATVQQKKDSVVKVSTGNIIEMKILGIKVAVGLSAQGNDYLRTRWASKDDWWFHAEGERSTHLIAKLDNISALDNKVFSILGSIIRDYSQMTLEQIPVIFTQVKNVKGVKGAAGKVIYKKIKYRTVDYISNWKEIISSD